MFAAAEADFEPEVGDLRREQGIRIQGRGLVFGERDLQLGQQRRHQRHPMRAQARPATAAMENQPPVGRVRHIE